EPVARVPVFRQPYGVEAEPVGQAPLLADAGVPGCIVPMQLRMVVGQVAETELHGLGILPTVWQLGARSCVHASPKGAVPVSSSLQSANSSRCGRRATSLAGPSITVARSPAENPGHGDPSGSAGTPSRAKLVHAVCTVAATASASSPVP